MAFTIAQGHPIPELEPGDTGAFTIDIGSDVPISGQQEWIGVSFPAGVTFPQPGGEVRYIAAGGSVNQPLTPHWDPNSRQLRFQHVLHLNDGTPEQNGSYSVSIQALPDTAPGFVELDNALEIAGWKASLEIEIFGPAQGGNSASVQRPADRTYWAWGADRWETSSAGTYDLPGARIPLRVGGSPARGALFVATFSAEAIVGSPDKNTAVFLDVLFGGNLPHPVSGNHRYLSVSGNEWNSHTTLRIMRFAPQTARQDATAQVKVTTGSNVGVAGIQNWVLKIERYNL
ncbi:hypothetical protein [Streptomyces sp. NPDC053048]|uniref:hypothetical protein n=1 Tax=Streptomyces sp. NPDC053048 TaxID=3365694 RepID=UPI0037D922AE